MKECLNRFFNDRGYAISWTLFSGVIAIGLLAVFILSLIVSQVTAWYQGNNEYPANTISVQADAEVVAVPDTATFNFSVDITAESVELAQEEATKKVNDSISYLKEQGIDEKDIKTNSYNVSPRYEYPICSGINCRSERQLIGYQVNQSIDVKVRDTEKAGAILTGLGSRGLNYVSSLSFVIDDMTALEEEARDKAIKNARDKAKKLADSLGVNVVRVVSFSEDAGGYQPAYYEKSLGLGGSYDSVSSYAPELPVGENTITSRVYITYEIR